MREKPLPNIIMVQDVELIRFAYELHILAGDFLRESEYNLRSLITNTGADSIAIMGKNHMWLSDAVFAYCATGDLHQMIDTTEYLGARAFLFHTDWKENDRLYGSVMMMDLDTLRQDVAFHTIYPEGVSIEDQDGRKTMVGLEKWRSMELNEKETLKSWGFAYAPEKVAEWRNHYSQACKDWKEQSFFYADQDLEELLNTEYMLEAHNSDMDKYRIPLETARQLLLYEGAPVYRLFPGGAEKIPPIEVLTTGLAYDYYREFAVTPEDFGAVDRLVKRETERMIGGTPPIHKAEKSRTDPAR